MKRQSSIRVDCISFKEAKKVFDAYGLSFSSAVNLFLRKVALYKKIPFELDLSDELLDRIEKVEKNKNTTEYSDIEKLFKDLGL